MSAPGARVLVTTCSAEKDPRPEPLPARRRYTHPRIAAAEARALALGAPLHILSGVFGLLAAEDAVLLYDHALREDEVLDLVPAVADALRSAGAAEVVLFTEDESSPGFAPYHRLMRLACAAAGVRLVHEAPGAASPG